MERSGSEREARASETAARKGQRTEVEFHEKQEKPLSSKTKSIKVQTCLSYEDIEKSENV